MVKGLFLFASVAAATDAEWEQFKTQFGRSYNGDGEETARRAIFNDNLGRITDTNSQNLGYTLGVNQFADITEAEWSATFKGAKKPDVVEMAPNLGMVEEHAEVAASIDWVSRGAVTPVKDQGQCGSCWSFGATGGTEGSYQIATGSLKSLAEQQIVDCDTTDGNQGCSGGWPYAAVSYLSANGACSESSYPYTAREGTCKVSSCSKTLQAGTVSGYKNVAQTDSGFVSALNNGPVSVTINAEGYAFQLYSSGVMKTKCSGGTDHAVLAVGYGTLDGVDYYRVKNSWGTSWGDAGYFNVERNNGAGGSICILQDAPIVPQISASVSV